MTRPCGHTPDRPGRDCPGCTAAAGLVRVARSRKVAAPPRPRPSLPQCPHRGEPTGELAPCADGKGCKQRVFRCEVHGTCTVQRSAHPHCCDGCPDRPTDPWSLVAPLGTKDVERSWEGRVARKPHHFRVTCLLPHLNTPEYLEACVALLRLQTLRPYVIVVDTGSPKGVCDELEAMRAEDLEVHYVRAGGYTHSSEPVCVALDLGMARVNTELVLLTHTDVFLKRRDAVAWLAGQCSAGCPAVGWEMSPRKNAPSQQWRGMVSHTFTMLHAATMRRLGVTWHMQRARDLLGLSRDHRAAGWPDTEVGPNLILRAAGVTPKILGPEPNYALHRTEWFDHARSVAGLSAYAPGTALHRRATAYGAKALEDARHRISAWSSTSVPAQGMGHLRSQNGSNRLVGTQGVGLPTEDET